MRLFTKVCVLWGFWRVGRRERVCGVYVKKKHRQNSKEKPHEYPNERKEKKRKKTKKKTQ